MQEKTVMKGALVKLGSRKVEQLLKTSIKRKGSHHDDQRWAGLWSLVSNLILQYCKTGIKSINKTYTQSY